MGLFNKKKDAIWTSYNVGDLFDDKIDGTEYGEFKDNWTTENYHKKVANLTRVFDEIISRNTKIELACIQEVENEETLEYLRKSSKQLSLLEHKKFIRPEGHSLGHAILSAYEFAEEPKIYDSALFNTNKRFVRPIIYAKLKVKKNIIVHLFAVHLPSKKDETKEIVGIRKNMLTFINQETKDILLKEKNPYIVVMGDFNDENSEQTIYKLKNAYSLSSKPRGSIFYDYWQKIDQILYSDAFKYSDDNPLKIMSFNLFDDVTLLRVSKETGENVPAKFYYHTGVDENHGYSDHLPIAIKVNY